jgi:hypothetical protein
MLPITCEVVPPDDFDKLFREEARIATFASPDDEAAYYKRDAFLIHLIRREVQRHFGTDEDQQLFVGDDWWPDHTRHLEATPTYCTVAFFTALRSLLTDDYKDYRIQICVYGDLLDGESYIGSMALYVDRLLIENKLHEFFQRTEIVL